MTFTDLGEADRQRFSNYLDGELLTVVRVISLTDNKIQTKYHGSRRANPEFRPVRSAGTAGEVKKAYKSLTDSGKYPMLPSYTNREDALEALEGWEAKSQGLESVTLNSILKSILELSAKTKH